MKYPLWLSLLPLLTACHKAPSNDQHNNIAVTAGDTAIYMQEVDSALQIKLYDLNSAIYHLRRNRTQEIVNNVARSNRLEIGTTFPVNVLLQPPKRPRIDLPDTYYNNPRLLRGNQHAPIIVSVFCSYQSSHCARLQPILLQVLETYSDILLISYVDFPQAYHRYAYTAAKAARCVQQQRQVWRFQDLLFSQFNDLKKNSLINLAETLDIPSNEFQRCLDNPRINDAIDKDVNMAKSLGIGKVPLLLINGLYLPAPYDFAAIQELVDSEIARLQPERLHATGEAHLSTLPIKLLGTSVSNIYEQSTALIVLNDTNSTFFNLGDELLHDVILSGIQNDRITIQHRGKTEIIRLWVNDKENTDESAIVLANNNIQMGATDNTTTSDFPNIPAPTATLSLSRYWIDSQLDNLEQLQEQIVQTDHVVEDYHLVKLAHNQQENFYQRLGLKPNDVLMMVNKQWIHSGQNPLWDILQQEETVEFVIMRKGFPVVYNYRIGEND